MDIVPIEFVHYDEALLIYEKLPQNSADYSEVSLRRT